MSFLENIYSRFESKSLAFLANNNWQLRIVAIATLAMLLSFFNNQSPLHDFRNFYDDVIVKKGEYFLYNVTKDRSQNLTEHRVYEEPASNNRVFRLTLPVLVKIFHIRHVSVFVYGLQLILGILLYFLLTRFLFQILNDKLATMLAVIALACIYFGTSFFVEYAGYGDFYTFFFLFLSIYFRNPLLVFGAMFTATWCDERAVVAGSLVFAYWWIAEKIKEDKPISFVPNKQMLAIIAAEIGYISLRYYLMTYQGMEGTYKKGEFTEQLFASLPSFGFKFIWILEGFWLIMLLAFLILYIKKDYLKLLIVFGGTIAMIVSGFTTFDSTRSGSFVFPMIFLGLIAVKTKLNEKEIRVLLLLVALLCFLHPLANKTHGVGYFLM
ncbi:hypothetical protein [Emticicia sp. SJ17W-69]|uniref:hypothetical protein n=1 Tax=Emticicia sp. SJ17W-69 TaxID=3421657 RepID=UPI003EBB8417